MKMMIVVVNNNDCQYVIHKLEEDHFKVTKLVSQGMMDTSKSDLSHDSIRKLSS